MKLKICIVFVLLIALFSLAACNQSAGSPVNDSSVQEEETSQEPSEEIPVAKKEEDVASEKAGDSIDNGNLIDWVGLYQFLEYYPGDGTPNSGSNVLYDLVITEDGTNIVGTLSFSKRGEEVPFAVMQGTITEISSKDEIGFVATSQTGELLAREYEENAVLFQLSRGKYNRITTTWVDWQPYEERETSTLRHKDISFSQYKKVPMADKEVTITLKEGEYLETEPELMEVVTKYIPTFPYTEDGEDRVGISVMHAILGLQFDETNRAPLLSIELFESIYSHDNGKSAYEAFGIMYPQDVVESLMAKRFGFDGVDLREIMPSYDASQEAYEGSFGGYGGGGGNFAVVTQIEKEGEYTVFNYDVYYVFMGDLPNIRHLESQATLVLKIEEDGNYEYISNEYNLNYPVK